MFAYRVAIPPAVAERLRRLPPDLKRAVREAIRAIARDPKVGTALQRELHGYRKYRVRRYRVIYRIEHEAKSIRIAALGHRREVYEELAAAAGRIEGAGQMPKSFGRAEEAALLEFCATSDLRPERWAAQGPAFFMAGLATLLASARGFERRRYLQLAEALHPGVTEPEVFGAWLKRSPLRAARFLPRLKKKMGL